MWYLSELLNHLKHHGQILGRRGEAASSRNDAFPGDLHTFKGDNCIDLDCVDVVDTSPAAMSYRLILFTKRFLNLKTVPLVLCTKLMTNLLSLKIFFSTFSVGSLVLD